MLDIYKDKKALVTGHTGFKGSWLAIWLRELGAEVVGYSIDPPSIVNNFEVTKLKDKIHSVHGDVRDYEKLKKVFSEFEPEFVFHLAAQPIVRLSYEEPQMTFETNVMGTVNLLELARSTTSVRTLINVTSDKCYENKEWLWGYRENDRLGGHDPYSNSKACSELVTQCYINSFFSNRDNIGVASVRAGNVIGGGDWASDRIVPDCLRSLSEQKDIFIRNPTSVRPWQLILEALYGYLLLASKLHGNVKDYTGAWNFGPSNDCCVPVSNLVDKIVKYWGSGKWDTDSPISDDGKKETTLLKLNCDKSHSLLEWRCVLDMESVVRMTIDWYKTYYQSPDVDMYSYSSSQIKEYTDAQRRKTD